MAWIDQKPVSEDLKLKSIESAAWLCHGLPWSRCDELEKLLKLYQSQILKNPDLIEALYQLLSIFAAKNPRPLLSLLDSLLTDLFRCLNTIIKVQGMSPLFFR